MGAWGFRLYENDTALDVRDMIDDIFDNYSGEDAINKLLTKMATDYTDKDKNSIAWLVVADNVLKRGIIDVSALYKTIAEGQGVLSQDTIDNIIESLKNRDLRKKHRARQRFNNTAWLNGDVFIYNVRPEYAQLPEFADYIIGFICIGHYKYRTRHPIVYVFRIKKSVYKDTPEISDIISNAQFWKICNWGKLGYAYRVMLWADKASNIPESCFHHIGNTTVLPNIPDEFIINDIASLPSFLWDEIEVGLLRTSGLMGH